MEIGPEVSGNPARSPPIPGPHRRAAQETASIKRGVRKSLISSNCTATELLRRRITDGKEAVYLHSSVVEKEFEIAREAVFEIPRALRHSVMPLNRGVAQRSRTIPRLGCEPAADGKKPSPRDRQIKL